MERSATEATMSRLFQTRLLRALVTGLGGLLLGGLFAAALFLGIFDGGPLKPARAEVATSVVLAAGDGPTRPSVPGLCFHGPGGELLDLAPAGTPTADRRRE
jgi:hypothetical protein